MTITRSFLIGCVGATLFAGAAAAQNKLPAQQHSAPPATPVSTEPQTTTASYGSWTLRCQNRQQGSGENRLCEVDQGIVPQGQQSPIAQIAISRPSPKEEMHVTAVLPTNITFPNAPKISNDEKDPGVELVWRRCLPGACIADATLREDVVRKWHNDPAENSGRLIFVDASGRTINIQFSFHGFGQAVDALQKEK